MKHFLRYWKIVPYVFILMAPWTLLKIYEVSTALNTVVGGGLLIFALLVIAVEFYKSGDIGLASFQIDTAFSGLQLIACTAVMTLVIVSPTGRVSIPDVLLCGVVLLDCWFSPVNAFRTALRNLQLGPSSMVGS